MHIRPTSLLVVALLTSAASVSVAEPGSREADAIPTAYGEEFLQQTLRIKELQHRRDALQCAVERTQGLLNDIAASRESIDRLSVTCARLKQQVASANRHIENLRRWSRVHFVLGNDKTNSLAGLTCASQHCTLAAFTDDPGEIENALRVARNSSVQVVATGSARTVLARITALVRSGQASRENRLPDEIAVALRELVWTPREYVGVPAAKRLPFVVYRDAEDNRQHVAVLRDVKQMLIRRLAKRDETIDRSRIVSGSLWGEYDRDILPVVEAGAPFLDYCALAVAHRLSNAPEDRSFRKVAVRMDKDRFVKEFENAPYNHLFARFYGHRRFTPPVPSHIVRDAPRPELRKLARGIEDDLIERLTSLGIAVYERERGAETTLEQLYSKAKSLRDFDRLTGATHLLQAEIDDSADGARFRLNLRLIDLVNGQSIWSENDERTALPIEQANPFLTASGRPVVLTPKRSLQADLKSAALESPLKVPLVWGTTKSFARKLGTYVLLQEAVAPGKVEYRPFFGDELHGIDPAAIDVEYLRPQDTPTGLRVQYPSTRSQLLRYVAWKMARKVMTPAGRVMKTEGRVVTVALGSDHGITPRTTLRVQRSVANATGGTVRTMLPVRLQVTDVLDGQTCRAIVTRPNVSGLLEIGDYSLRVGDMVLSRTESLSRLLILAPQPQPVLDGKLRSRLADYLASRGFRDRIQAVSQAVQARLVDAFDGLLPASSIITGNTASSVPAFSLGGTVTCVGKGVYRIELRLKKWKRAARGAWTDGAQVETVKFQLRDGDW